VLQPAVNQPEEGNMDWSAILNEIVLPIVATIVVPIVLMFIKRGIDEFSKKTGLEVSKEHRAIIEDLVRKGVAYAEEQARKKIVTSGEVPDGESKLEMAIDFVKSGAKAMGVEVNGDNVAKLIEAQVFKDREKTPEED